MQAIRGFWIPAPYAVRSTLLCNGIGVCPNCGTVRLRIEVDRSGKDWVPWWRVTESGTGKERQRSRVDQNSDDFLTQTHVTMDWQLMNRDSRWKRCHLKSTALGSGRPLVRANETKERAASLGKAWIYCAGTT